VRRNRSFGKQKDRVLRRFLIASTTFLAVAWIVAPTAFADSSLAPDDETAVVSEDTTSTASSGETTTSQASSTETVPLDGTTAPVESSDPVPTGDSTDTAPPETGPVAEQPPADDPVPPPVTVTPPADQTPTEPVTTPPVESPPPTVVTPPTDVAPEQPPTPDVGPDQPIPSPETKVGSVPGSEQVPTLVATSTEVTTLPPDSKSQRVLDRLVPQGENRPGHSTHHSAVPQPPADIFTRELPRPERSPTSSGSSGAAGATFSPDNAGARFALLGLLLSLMGASYLVLFAAREPKALCLLLRLERPG
jgi:hypothetical protein